MEFICNQCGIKFSSTTHKKFCNCNCRYKYLETSMLGENNPNYGNKWNNEQRKKASDRVKKEMESADRRYLSGSANRGKKFDAERIKQLSESNKGRKHPPKSEEQKRLIGIKSKEKFTSEYKEKQRKHFEGLGIWIPLEQKPDRDIYYKESNWIKRMFDIVENQKLSEFGVWHYKNNLNGLVRDHKYSRKSGFKNKVFPELLRHPANCRLIFHRENVSIAHKKNIGDNISLEQLFKDIMCYENFWCEQEICLKLIERFLAGDRWKNPFNGDKDEYIYYF